MKLIIDIPEEVVKAIQNGKDYRYDIHTAIAQGIPYEERPHGKWIDDVVPVDLVGRGNRLCRCSLCGHGDIQAKTQEVPYCWFCGAKMKETNNETDN